MEIQTGETMVLNLIHKMRREEFYYIEKIYNVTKLMEIYTQVEALKRLKENLQFN